LQDIPSGQGINLNACVSRGNAGIESQVESKTRLLTCKLYTLMNRISVTTAVAAAIFVGCENDATVQQFVFFSC
jgi:hypothetical protein